MRAYLVGHDGLGSWIREVWHYVAFVYTPFWLQTAEVNTFEKKLLVCFHRGCLWLDTHISIDVELITTIIGLPKVGVDMEPLFVGKE